MLMLGRGLFRVYFGSPPARLLHRPRCRFRRAPKAASAAALYQPRDAIPLNEARADEAAFGSAADYTMGTGLYRRQRHDTLLDYGAFAPRRDDQDAPLRCHRKKSAAEHFSLCQRPRRAPRRRFSEEAMMPSVHRLVTDVGPPRLDARLGAARRVILLVKSNVSRRRSRCLTSARWPPGSLPAHASGSLYFYDAFYSFPHRASSAEFPRSGFSGWCSRRLRQAFCSPPSGVGAARCRRCFTMLIDASPEPVTDICRRRSLSRTRGRLFAIASAGGFRHHHHGHGVTQCRLIT